MKLIGLIKFLIAALLLLAIINIGFTVLKEHVGILTVINWIVTSLFTFVSIVTALILMKEEAKSRRKESAALERQRLLYDSIPLPTSFWDKDGHMFDCNDAMVNFFKFDSKEEILFSYVKFSPKFQPDGSPSMQKAKELLTNTIEKGIQHTFLWTHIVGGENVPTEVTMTRITNKDGTKCAACYIQDLRSVYQVTDKMREVEEKVQLMLDMTPLGICLYDRNFMPLDCNKEALRIFGVENKEAYLDKDAIFMPETQPDGKDSLQLFNHFLNQAFEKGWFQSEYLAAKADGTLIPAETTFVRTSYKGEPAIIEYVRELTDIKNAQEKEREANELANMLLSQSPVCIEIWDENINLEYCNRQLLDMYGVVDFAEYVRIYPELMPTSQPDGSPSNEKWVVLMQQALRDGLVRFEWTQLTNWGEAIPTECLFISVTQQGRRKVICYSHDLREMKKMSEEILRREMVEEESSAKTRFLERMSHEIRTPMNIVLGTTDIQLQQDGQSLETREAFLRIRRSSLLLLNIINDILDLSKVESGKMQIIPGLYDTASFIVDTVQLNLLQIGSQKITFKLWVDENLPANLLGDELRLKQIINNLMSNAFKYTEEGQVLLCLGAENLRPEEMTLVIRVEDSGQGMSQEQVDKIFEIDFTSFNAKPNRSKEMMGEASGLGMTVTRHLVHLMGGSIEIESELGKGSVFTVRIPQTPVGDEVIGKEAAENLQRFDAAGIKHATEVVPVSLPHGRVLVVDDVEINLDIMEGILTPYEINMQGVKSGLAAIEKVKAGKTYDIIFMDHMMPDLNGIQTTKILRDMGYDLPIVALTANAIKDAADLFMKNGFSGYIPKPIDMKELHEYILRFIKR